MSMVVQVHFCFLRPCLGQTSCRQLLQHLVQAVLDMCSYTLIILTPIWFRLGQLRKELGMCVEYMKAISTYSLDPLFNPSTARFLILVYIILRLFSSRSPKAKDSSIICSHWYSISYNVLLIRGYWWGHTPFSLQVFHTQASGQACIHLQNF